MEKTISELVQLWNKVLRRIETRLNDRAIYTSMFEGSYVNEVRGDTLYVVFESSFATQLMRTKYSQLISESLSDVTDSIMRVVCLSKDELDEKKESEETKQENKLFKYSSIRKDLTFENFVVGGFNREANRAANLISANPGKMYNPLFIYSRPGLGKTHLLHSIGNYILSNKNPNAKILYITANEFVDEYIKYVRDYSGAEGIKDYFRNVDVLLFDDVQLLAGKVKTEEMFFYVYSHMINSGKQIVITSDRQPAELDGLEDRLVSRFSQGLTVKIDDPDTFTCENILRKKLQDCGFDLNNFDNSVISFFAEKFSKDIRTLESVVNRLNFQCSKTDKITLSVASEAVSSISGGKEIANQLSERKIINIVADYYDLSPSDLIGKVRTGKIALARHIAMYLIRDMLDTPLKKIGDAFGGKDHTTVMSALTKVEKELKTDPRLAEAIGDLKQRING